MANGVCYCFGGQIAQTSLSFVRFASRYFVKHHLRQHLKDILQWDKNRIKISNGKKK